MVKPLAKLVALLTPKRRWAQFSLASMFVVVTVLCVWLSVVVNRAHRQRDAVAAIKALGGRIVYEYQGNRYESRATLPEPSWLRHLLGDEYFIDVSEVSLGIDDERDRYGMRTPRAMVAAVTDADLLVLDAFPKLK